MPSNPYVLSGVIRDSDSALLSGAVVQVRNLNTGEYLSADTISITNSAGEYTVDLANFASGYSNGHLVRLYIYKPEQFSIYDTVINTSVGTEEKNITLTALTYAKPAEVASLIGRTMGFTMFTTINVVEICRLIADAESYIDSRTGHSWRSTTVTNEEHTMQGADYIYGTGRAMFLNHRAIKSFSTSTDKIEVHTGISTNNGYEQWQTTKTEGRNNNFWFDYDQGILFLRQATTPGKLNDIRVTYRYGESTVPGDVNMAARMWAAVQLLMGDDRSVILPSGESSNLSYAQKIEFWNNSVERVIETRKEYKVATAEHMVSY